MMINMKNAETISLSQIERMDLSREIGFVFKEIEARGIDYTSLYPKLYELNMKLLEQEYTCKRG